MFEEQQEGIDQSQAELRKVKKTLQKSKKGEKEDAANPIAEKIEQHEKTFFQDVDAAQARLEKHSKEITDKSAQALLKMDLKNVDFSIGKTAKEVESGTDTERTVRKIDKNAGELEEATREFNEDVPLFKAVSRAKKQYEEKAVPLVKQAQAYEKLKHAPADSKEESQRPVIQKAIAELAAAKKHLMRTNPTVIDPNLQSMYDDALEPIDADMKAMLVLEEYYARKDFARDHSKYFVFREGTGELLKGAELEKLTPGQQAEVLKDALLLRQKLETKVDIMSASEKHDHYFFEGKQKFVEGTWVGPDSAKPMLLAYLSAEKNKTNKRPQHEVRKEEAEGFLREIATLELKQMRSRLNQVANSLPRRVEDLTSFGGRESYGTYGKAQSDLFIRYMKIVLDEVQKLLESGECITIEEAEKRIHDIDIPKPEEADTKTWAIHMFQKAFPANVDHDSYGNKTAETFDVMLQQKLITATDPQQREKNLIALAQNARDHGLFDLAKGYYEEIFKEELAEKAQTVDKEALARKMRKNPEVQELVEQYLVAWRAPFEKGYREYCKRARKPIPTNQQVQDEFDKNRENLSERAFSIILDQAYMLELKKAVHREPNFRNYQHAVVWNDTYNNMFSNMEILYDQGWVESFFVRSDEDWNHVKFTGFVNVGMGMALAPLAGAVAGRFITPRLGSLIVSEGLVKKAAHIAADKSVDKFFDFILTKFGPQEFGRMLAEAHLAQGGGLI